MFNPATINVVLGTTRVSRAGKKKMKVTKFDHGKYILGDKTEITQSELLESRCGEGVTLDQDLRRYVLQLVTTYVVMKRDVVDYFAASNNDTVGQRWNDYEAWEGAMANGGIDPESKMTTAELEAKKRRHDRAREHSLKIFTQCSGRISAP